VTYAPASLINWPHPGTDARPVRQPRDSMWVVLVGGAAAMLTMATFAAVFAV